MWRPAVGRRVHRRALSQLSAVLSTLITKNPTKVQLLCLFFSCCLNKSLCARVLKPPNYCLMLTVQPVGDNRKQWRLLDGAGGHSIEIIIKKKKTKTFYILFPSVQIDRFIVADGSETSSDTLGAIWIPGRTADSKNKVVIDEDKLRICKGNRIKTSSQTRAALGHTGNTNRGSFKHLTGPTCCFDPSFVPSEQT